MFEFSLEPIWAELRDTKQHPHILINRYNSSCAQAALRVKLGPGAGLNQGARSPRIADTETGW